MDIARPISPGVFFPVKTGTGESVPGCWIDGRGFEMKSPTGWEFDLLIHPAGLAALSPVLERACLQSEVEPI